MKIGILTFHRAHNYGAVLQCYALQEELKRMGHNVQIIDYRQPYIERFYKPYDTRRMLFYFKKGKSVLWYIRMIPTRILKKRNFERFVSKYLNISNRCNRNNVPTDYDVYLIGSDQLWGLNCLGGHKDDIYLGKFIKNKDAKVIGYAISTNMASLIKIQEEGFDNYVLNFSLLSMREQFAVDFIKQHTTICPQMCLDPTLITEKSIWEPFINNKWEKENYILMYQVRKPQNDKKYLERKANKIAKELGCKVIDTTSMTYPVEEFISLIRFAKFIITTSFHATVFSIIFEKKFYSIKLNDGRDARYENLLNLLGIGNRCVNMDFEFHDTAINYENVKIKLSILQKDSKLFLSKI